MAMKLVAAAKVRRAQDAVLATRPFSETLQSVFGGLIQRLGGESVDLPLLTEREVKKVTLTVITGDRGLCGGYNSMMIKKAEARYNELTAAGKKQLKVRVDEWQAYVECLKRVLGPLADPMPQPS